MADKQPAKQIAGALAGGLWFPLFFFFGFLFCYVLPFHSPAPHDVKVAVSGPVAAAELRAGLEQKAPGAYDIVPVADPAEAREAVEQRDAVAAYAVNGKDATLYTAKANGISLDTVVTTTFTEVAAQSSGELKTVDLAPLAGGDATGTGSFYVSMVWNIVGYIAGMFMLRVVAIGRRGKLFTLVGLGAFISVVGYFIALAMDVVPNEPLAILYAFLINQAVAWITFGLAPFVKHYIPGVALGMFVLLSIPSSGGAIPHEMVPGFFRWLHPVMPLGNLIDALRGIFYFDGHGLLRPTLVLCAWLLAGIALVAVGAVRQRRREQQVARDAADEAEAALVEAPEVAEDPTFETRLPHPVAAGARGHTVPMLLGKVTEGEDKAVAGAAVTVMDGHGRQLLRAVTDHDGMYAATDLPEESVSIVLSSPGRAPAVARIVPRSGSTLVKDFVLPRRAQDSTPSAGVIG
ncbi:carboxypeptidase regulatory-like domain-containing protein [Streptomyces sp. NPDC001255]|uniref:carboxypeptidase regulatory-like domain-containing protein n=1 Tax=Streptomyces sp. NPDC001255 TaxID=3364550 RepID=UPI0036A1C8A9